MLLLRWLLLHDIPVPSVTCGPPPVTVEKPTTTRRIIRLIARVMAGRDQPQPLSLPAQPDLKGHHQGQGQRRRNSNRSTNNIVVWNRSASSHPFLFRFL